MTLQTDLSRSPYFDDYDSTKNYYKILYRPGFALQTRELNQMQTIMQDQIDKFGRHIFQDGSVVEGCAFTFDTNYTYVKINDNYANGSAFNSINDFIGSAATNVNGLSAIIVNGISGYQSSDPDLNTLYLKYNTTAAYTNGTPQGSFDSGDTLVMKTSEGIPIGNLTVASVANATGNGYAFTTTAGVIFKKGYFITVNPSTTVISKYNNYPDGISVGFDAVESIVTVDTDSSLYDNAAGSPNYTAPGAHRLKMVPTLTIRNIADSSNTNSFFSLCDFKSGKPVSIKNDPQYGILQNEFARRTYETNGNYIVYPFVLTTEEKANNDPFVSNNVNLVSSAGLGYVEGYRVQYVNNNKVDLRKGTDVESISSATVSLNYGNYVYVNEVCGEFNTDTLVQVELHSVAKTSLSGGTYLSTGYSGSTKIGTAYLRGFILDSGTPGTSSAQYRAYLFAIGMTEGFNFSNVKSMISYNGGLLGVADIVTTSRSIANSSGGLIQVPGAFLEESVYSNMIFPIGQKAIKLDGFNHTQYVYRNRAAGTFSNLVTGSMTLNLGTVKGTASESIIPTGTYSHNEANMIRLIPTTAGYSTNKTGTVSVSGSGANIVGNATTFLTDYSSGEFIYINSETQQINQIVNNAFMNITSTFVSGATANTHKSIYPAGVAINLGTTTRSVTSTNTSITITLGEELTGSFNAVAYFDVLRSSTVPMKKKMKRNVYVAINCASHFNTTSGPWSLGLADMYRINHIYVNDAFFSNTVADVVDKFRYTTGQTDSYYGLSYLISAGIPLNSTSRILVDMDVFSFDMSQGVGFFTANSYPVDDTNTANTNSIKTEMIPQYKGNPSTFDLRDCIDFRPFANNTANISANSTNWASYATINPSSDLNFYVDTSYGSYIPTPDGNFESDLQHYLGRKDRAVIRQNGDLIVVEGIPSNTPAAPLEPNGSMGIGIINVPPYPSLSSKYAKNINRYDYAITTSMTQNKRYTMKDIGAINNRIDRLEYYTSLSLLEKSASSLLVRSNNTGQNRFQNGILVDPFKGHDIGNTKDPAYNISIEPVENMRPKFSQTAIPIVFDATQSQNVVSVGELVLLDYNEVPYISQPFASKYRNCIEGNIYHYTGRIDFNPTGDFSPDITKSPDVTTNLDLASNFVNIAKAFGTKWDNWTTTDTATNSTTGDATKTASSTDQYGNVTDTYNTTTTTTTDATQTRTGTQLGVTVTNNSYNLGTFVTDLSILPYIKSMTTYLTATGLKPNTRVYAFANDIDVNSCVMPLDGYVNTTQGTGGTNSSTAYGDGNTKSSITVKDNSVPGQNQVTAIKKQDAIGGSPLITDSTGTLHAAFLIPVKTFTSTTIEFKLVDVPDPVTGADAITTSAVGNFYGSNISISKGAEILNTREAEVISTTVGDSQVVHSVTSNTAVSVKVTAAPQPNTRVVIINNNNANTITTANTTNITDVSPNHNFMVQCPDGSWVNKNDMCNCNDVQNNTVEVQNTNEIGFSFSDIQKTINAAVESDKVAETVKVDNVTSATVAEKILSDSTDKPDGGDKDP
jgi:hypothetical protein